MTLRTTPAAIPLLFCALACSALAPASAQDGLVVEGQASAPVTSGEAATPAAQADPAEQPEPDKDPVSGLELFGMMRRLSATMKGQPVIAVGDSRNWSDGDAFDNDLAHARTLIEKLQAISAQGSSETQTLIPFRVGNAYVIAPETREGVNINLGGLSPLQAASRGALIEDVILRLTPAQVRALGSEEGLALSSLPADYQAALQQAFRPPLDIVEMVPDTFTDDDGTAQQGYRSEERGKLTEVDWRRSRIRARLRTQGAEVRQGNYGTTIGYGEGRGLTFSEPDSMYVPWEDRGTDLPIYAPVPNTFKPSDLDGKRYTQAFQLTGVWKMKDVLARLEKATGLKLRAWKTYEDVPVFLGSPALTVGEVLDGVRLALTASWRRMGDTYLLAWDRMPLQAIQLLARESATATTKDLRKRTQEMQTDPAWITLVQTLPFAADDPLALTRDQRERLFSPKKDGTNWYDRKIPFTEMTPDQQAYIRDRAKVETMYVPSSEPNQPGVRRPITDTDVMQSGVSAGGRIEVSLQVPGKGWVSAPNAWTEMTFHAYMLQRAMEKANPQEQPKRNIMDSAPPEAKAWLEKPKPLSIPAAMRAIMVPALGPARLSELADEMQRHGLTTLFYPALSGGYATLPSKSFPLDPALRGADGLAAAVAAMKPKGIGVVATVSVLAWQDQGDTAHWLGKHPDWLDVDAAGRPRLSWLASHPDAMKTYLPFGIQPANYVRPAEPAVQAKLTTLLAEVSAVKGVAGAAFLSWASPGPMPSINNQRLSPPPLGYAVPDRLAAFEKTGVDPADRVGYNDYMPASLRDFGIWGHSAEDAPNPGALLLDRLIKQARAQRPDWKVYSLEDAPGNVFRPNTPAAPALAKPDLSFRSLFMGGPGDLGQSGLILPVGKRSIFDEMRDATDDADAAEVPAQLQKLPSLAIYSLILGTEPQMKNMHIPAMLFDFRTAPEIITESLPWIQPPPAPTTAKGAN